MIKKKMKGFQPTPNADPQILEKILELEKKKKELEIFVGKSEDQILSLRKKIRNMRIIPQKNGSQDIVCYCGKRYNSTKDTQSILKKMQPMCWHCKAILELPI